MYEQLGRLGQDARAADEEWSRLLRQREELEAGRAQTVEEVTELETRLRNAQETQQVDAAEPASMFSRQQIAAAAENARGVEVEARLAVRTAEERANAVRGRADSLRRAAAAEREARLRAQQARAARLRAAAVAAAVADAGRLLASRLDRVVAAASAIRDALVAERQERVGGDGGGARRGARAERPGGHPHRFAAPRRGGQRPGGAAHRAARADGARAVRHGARPI